MVRSNTTPRVTPSRSPLVGRDREMGALRGLVAAAGAGAGALYLLVGEEGVGKTRLAEECGAEARGRGLDVRWGRCLPEGVAPPLWPWREALLGAGAAPLAPELAALLEEEPGDAAERFRRFQGVVSLLRRREPPRPTLIVLDDLHRADGASLELLRLLGPLLRELPLLVLATARHAEGAEGPRAELWAELLREARPLPLTGLDEAGAGALLRGALGAAVEAGLGAELRAYTDGNPYFLEGVARALAAEGRGAAGLAAWRALPLPADLRQAIRARVGALPEPAQRLLRAAAVLGRELDVGIAALAAGLDLPQRDAALRDALRDGLLRSEGGDGERVAFRHPLVQEALRQDMGRGGGAALHLAIAQALERTYGAAPEHLAELAHHFSAALPLGPLDSALRYLERAARQARDALDYAAAESLLGRAVALLESREGATARLCLLLIELGEAHLRAGHGDAARGACGRAASVARALSDPRLLARAALGLGLDLGGFSCTVAPDAAVLAGLREALGALPPEETGLRARCLARLALELYHDADLAPSRAAAREALRLAEALGDDGVLLAALRADVLCHTGPDLPPAALSATADRVLAIAARLQDREAEFHGHHLRVAASLMTGDRGALDLAIAACTRIAEEQRAPRYRWQAGVFAAMRALLDGRLGEVVDLAQAACDVGLPVVGEAASESLVTHLFDLHWALGRLGETAEAHLQRADRYPYASAWTPGLVLALLAAGRRAEARAHFDRVMASGLDRIRRDELWLITLALLAEAAARLGAEEAAAELRQRLLPHRGLAIDTRFGRHLLGTTDRVLGMVAGALGLRQEASAHFEAADALHVRLGAMRWLAEGRCDHAEVLLTGDAADRARAEALLDSTGAIAGELGLEGAAARVRALRSSALRAAPPAPPLSGVFLRDGGAWVVGLGGRSSRVADGKGLRYLAQLLGRPGETVHVLELGAAEAPAPEAAGPAPGGRRSLGGAGPALDGRTRAAYRERLSALRVELREADAWADAARRERLQAELAALSNELAGAFGLGGRSRPIADHTERLRKAVYKCVRGALERIEAAQPELGEHLRRAVRIGVTCAYLPSTNVRWRLD